MAGTMAMPGIERDYDAIVVGSGIKALQPLIDRNYASAIHGSVGEDHQQGHLAPPALPAADVHPRVPRSRERRICEGVVPAPEERVGPVGERSVRRGRVEAEVVVIRDPADFGRMKRGAILVAPAMNTHMWEHPATQANAETLRSRGSGSAAS